MKSQDLSIDVNKIAKQIIIELKNLDSLDSITDFRKFFRDIIENNVKNSLRQFASHHLEQNKIETSIALMMETDTYKHVVNDIERKIWDAFSLSEGLNKIKSLTYSKNLIELDLNLLQSNLNSTRSKIASLKKQKAAAIATVKQLNTVLVNADKYQNLPEVAEKLIKKGMDLQQTISGTLDSSKDLRAQVKKCLEILDKHKANHDKLIGYTLPKAVVSNSATTVQSMRAELHRITKEMTKLEKFISRYQYSDQFEVIKFIFESEPLIDRLYQAQHTVYIADSFIQSNKISASKKSKSDKRDIEAFERLTKKTKHKMDSLFNSIEKHTTFLRDIISQKNYLDRVLNNVSDTVTHKDNSATNLNEAINDAHEYYSSGKDSVLVKQLDDRIENLVSGSLEDIHNNLIELKGKLADFEDYFQRSILISTDKVMDTLENNKIGRDKKRIIFIRDLSDKYRLMVTSLKEKILPNSEKTQRLYDSNILLCDEIKNRIDKIYDYYVSVLGKKFTDIDCTNHPLFHDDG